jgi:hypothetical protein
VPSVRYVVFLWPALSFVRYPPWPLRGRTWCRLSFLLGTSVPRKSRTSSRPLSNVRTVASGRTGPLCRLQPPPVVFHSLGRVGSLPEFIRRPVARVQGALAHGLRLVLGPALVGPPEPQGSLGLRATSPGPPAGPRLGPGGLLGASVVPVGRCPGAPGTQQAKHPEPEVAQPPGASGQCPSFVSLGPAGRTTTGGPAVGLVARRCRHDRIHSRSLHPTAARSRCC